ncbi:nitrile hydratase accessory protein [Aeromicrobium sp. CFBP 8757]|uniref:nitrile hydratase accessory protein n=1 Tax=Aeromicrobium sp. CFBP 8757 TaxID=2775288 RepID=UPI0017863014|nr:nitrile hydratase accessory protein [Aeromicrobium sp. CFBP 8757]MBD8605398.1 nitrile hydratase accessory protein [Aeromicrobium sp. CFBP 8757]
MSAEHATPTDRVQLDEMTGDSAVPRANGELVFDAPWHARAFGLAVSLCQDGAFEWIDFQHAISEEIARREQSGVDEYYECWLAALSVVMSEQVAAELPAREDEFRSHERDEVF